VTACAATLHRSRLRGGYADWSVGSKLNSKHLCGNGVVRHVEIEPVYNANAHSNLSIVLDTHTRVEQDHPV
jgi:hypothetical protein